MKTSIGEVMQKIISLELLSELLDLNKKITIGITIVGNEVVWDGDYNCNGRINIYELMHKAIKWILSHQELPFQVIDVYPTYYRANDSRPAYVSVTVSYFYELEKSSAGISEQDAEDYIAVFKICQRIINSRKQIVLVGLKETR